MRLYEISNHSDPYTIETDDVEAASALVLYLGTGNYSMCPADGGKDDGLPLFMFGTADDLDAWWSKRFGHVLKTFAHGPDFGPRVAAAADCLMIGSPADRKRLGAILACISDPGGRAKALATWHEERRTSLNDIGGRAAKYAKSLRERHAQVAR